MLKKMEDADEYRNVSDDSIEAAEYLVSSDTNLVSAFARFRNNSIIQSGREVQEYTTRSEDGYIKI